MSKTKMPLFEETNSKLSKPSKYRTPIFVRIMATLSLASFIYIALILVVLITKGQYMDVLQQQILKKHMLIACVLGIAMSLLTMLFDCLAFRKYAIKGKK